MDAFDKDFKGTMRGGLRMMLPEKTDAELVKSILTRAEAQDPKMALPLMRDLVKTDTKVLLKEAKVPVRCINAAPGLPLAIASAPDVNKKSADFAAVIMGGVGHYPMLERRGEFNDKLRRVLRGLGKGPPLRALELHMEEDARAAAGLSGRTRPLFWLRLRH